jgi:hypothetical protein
MTKKLDSEVEQAVSAVTLEHDTKRKCVELDRFERGKAMHITDILTKEPVHGVLAQLDASLAINASDFVNVLGDLSPLKMSHGGKGYVTGKETKDGVPAFTLK